MSLHANSNGIRNEKDWGGFLREVRKLLFKGDIYRLKKHKSEHKGAILIEKNYPIKILKERNSPATTAQNDGEMHEM